MIPAKFTDTDALIPGKNAAVFRAKNSLVGREVFLKMYPVPATDAGSALREPHLLTELEHENLVKIYGADSLANGHILLEMELVTGGSFQQLIDESTKKGVWPSTHTCIHLVSDVAAGLLHLNKRGFVHRDIKPANLVIRINGGKQQGVVTDLGLVSRLDDTGRAFASRHARIYRPPEVWAGKGYSARSDVYQLGIVLFQLLGGYLDHKQGNLDDVDLAARVKSGNILDTSTIGADVDTALRKVVKKAIAPEAERYETMGEFLVALNNAKLQQLDWVYIVTAKGFSLERKKGNATFRVDAEVKGKNYKIQRKKAGANGVFRKKNPDIKLSHQDIGICREFRTLLDW